jgi:methylase of polypeptide subunit release factors
VRFRPPFGRRVSARRWADVRVALLRPEADTTWVREVLVREQPIPRPAIGRPDLLDTLVALGLVDDGATVTPRWRLTALGDRIIASDLLRHRHAVDFVAGPARASLTLMRHVEADPRRPVLDLGCGSGVLGLLVGDRDTPIVAIDINPRAVAVSQFNAGLNGFRHLEARHGDFLTADLDRRLERRFGTVIANPPFALAPSTGLVYRDRPLPGDLVGARTVDQVARALSPTGRGYVLCNWIDRGAHWSDPVRQWLEAAGRAGSVVRLATLSVPDYAAFWTRDLPESARAAAAAAWVAGLLTEDVAQVHVGVVTVVGPAESLAAVDRRARHSFAARDAIVPAPTS